MALQAASGNYGEVIVGGSVVGEINNWKATIDRGGKSYGAQSGVDGTGKNWEKTLSGTGKVTGSFDGMFDPNFPVGSIVDTDALITLSLYLVKPGIAGQPVSYMTGSARIFSRDLSAPIDTGDPEPFTTNFQYHGKPTFNNM
jgi:hypothetical protein